MTKFVIILSLKIPPYLKCVATLPCEMSSVFKNFCTPRMLNVNRFSIFCLCLVMSSLISLAFGQCFSKVLFAKNFVTMRVGRLAYFKSRVVFN